jgi:hypothetical protein
VWQRSVTFKFSTWLCVFTSSEEAFVEIENEMIRFSNNHSNIALVGDFNPRSDKFCDIVEIDEDFFISLM